MGAREAGRGSQISHLLLAVGGDALLHHRTAIAHRGRCWCLGSHQPQMQQLACKCNSTDLHERGQRIVLPGIVCERGEQSKSAICNSIQLDAIEATGAQREALSAAGADRAVRAASRSSGCSTQLRQQGHPAPAAAAALHPVPHQKLRHSTVRWLFCTSKSKQSQPAWRSHASGSRGSPPSKRGPNVPPLPPGPAPCACPACCCSACCCCGGGCCCCGCCGCCAACSSLRCLSKARTASP